MKPRIPFRRFLSVWLACLAFTLPTRMTRAQALLAESPSPSDFVLAGGGGAAGISLDPGCDPAIVRAAGDLASDIERVTGLRPSVSQTGTDRRSPIVLIGVLGRSPLIDQLAAAGRIDATGLRGQWESFLIQAVPHPADGIDQALVVAGSDRRGAIYGIYELSESIGVSPWYWWADVPPPRRASLAIRAGSHRAGPPSVKYRGIFLNDEDWGLQPWAAKTFEPETGDIGPKTYARICELLLRLKANTLWPAMHGCTRAFNLIPQNRVVADAYGIVMGSSHAEPMLRNNVTEWTAPHESYNYLINREGVHAYWEQRVRENGRFENLYTLGMRGIHDSAMVGPATEADRIRTLEQIFADQRAILAFHVNADVTQVPQVFTPYKEVLDIYRRGLRVPGDVTLVWPDDNFGYLRHVPTPDEQRRPGGNGVYYHLSYLGRPLSYLWLSTTPPSLVWEEMGKAYDHGARTLWIANVGDLKPAEIGTDFFLQMAWDIGRWRRENLPEFLASWATREFGAAPAREIAGIMDAYYRLNFQRRPEHLQWWMPKEKPCLSALTIAEIRQRLDAFAELKSRADRIGATMPADRRDAFSELVGYPVTGAALANRRFLEGELAARRAAAAPEESAASARRAAEADRLLAEATRRYNEEIAGGKWRHLMSLEPADSQWQSMRIAPWVQPPPAQAEPESPAPPPPSAGSPPAGFSGFAETGGLVSIEAEHFTRKVARAGVSWEVIPGLGRSGDSVAVFPTTAAHVDPAQAAEKSPMLGYRLWLATAGEVAVTVDLLPAQPVADGTGLRLALGLDDEPPLLLTGGAEVGSKEWSQSVLDAKVSVPVRLKVAAPGVHELRLYMVDPGVVVDRIVLDAGGLRPGYLGPPETKVGF